MLKILHVSHFIISAIPPISTKSEDVGGSDANLHSRNTKLMKGCSFTFEMHNKCSNTSTKLTNGCSFMLEMF